MKIVITGGSGFLANHLIKFLQENSYDIIDEIRTIDRKAFNQFLSKFFLLNNYFVNIFLDYSNNIKLIHFKTDLCDTEKLKTILEGTNVVFHLARKSFEYLFQIDENYLNKQYYNDNLNGKI